MKYFVIYFPMQTLCLNSQYPTIKNIWLLLWVCFVNGLQSSKQTFQGKRNQSGHCIVFLLVEHLVKGANNSGFCFEWNYESDVEELFIKSCTIGIWLRRCKKKKKTYYFSLRGNVALLWLTSVHLSYISMEVITKIIRNWTCTWIHYHIIIINSLSHY